VIVIVPSLERSKLWKDFADLTAVATQLEQTVEKLRIKHVGLAVHVNKYDGIDLPGDACRILVLDDLPSARGLSARYEEASFSNSDGSRARLVRGIEQGMGRGLRAADDLSVVVTMGHRLVDLLNHPRAIQMFTSGTRASIPAFA
jgi:Helicase C-terminal domain